MTKQTSFDKLQAERERLEAIVFVQKGELRNDFAVMKEQLQPAFQLLNKVGGVAKVASQTPLLRAGIGLGAGLLFGGKVFRKANPIIKFGLPIAWQILRSKIFTPKNA